MRPIPIWYDSYHRTPRAAVDTTAATTQVHVPKTAILSFFAYRAPRYRADATPNRTVVRLNRRTLLIVRLLLGRYPARRSLPRRLDAGLYSLKFLLEGKPVPAGRAREDDLRPPVRGRGEPDPDALVGKEEGHDDPDDHQGAPEPDDVDAGILGHLQAGVHLRVQSAEGQ